MLVCSSCAARFSTSAPRWRCECAGSLKLESPPLWLRESLDSHPASLWRYREALGIDRDSSIVTLGEGFTPLIESRFAGRPVQLKLDYLCPSGSYKDRGSAVLLSKLKEWGVSRIIEDSSGNAGASIAAYAALAGIEADIYVPASASAGSRRSPERRPAPRRRATRPRGSRRT